MIFGTVFNSSASLINTFIYFSLCNSSVELDLCFLLLLVLLRIPTLLFLNIIIVLVLYFDLTSFAVLLFLLFHHLSHLLAILICSILTFFLALSLPFYFLFRSFFSCYSLLQRFMKIRLFILLQLSYIIFFKSCLIRIV